MLGSKLEGNDRVSLIQNGIVEACVTCVYTIINYCNRLEIFRANYWNELLDLVFVCLTILFPSIEDRSAFKHLIIVAT